MIEPTAFLNGRVILYGGDCLDVLAQLPENSIDAVCCDPPYHLTSIVKQFGSEGAAEAKGGATGAYKRTSAGFMGKKWDGGDIAFQVETWRKVLRVLKPGGYILAFASTRGFGRMSVALEDAGFVTHPLIDYLFDDTPEILRFLTSLSFEQLEAFVRLVDQRDGGMLAWIFGSGFPKATRIRAEGYDGYRYGGQALKPAIEPIYMGQKPFEKGLSGTENILKWGTGALWIDGCRIEAGGDLVEDNGDRVTTTAHEGYHRPNASMFYTGKPSVRNGPSNAGGRWPANIIHDGSDEVLVAFPDTAPAKAGARGGQNPNPMDWGNGRTDGDIVKGHTDNGGSAARFFYTVEKEERCDLCRVLLSGKYAKDSPCDANTAELTSPTQSTPNGATVRDGAAVSPPLGSAGKKQPSNDHAIIAESSSFQCRQTSGSFAPSDALTQEASRIALHVRSAANLCASCETDIAQSLAAMRLGLDPASLPCLGSMPARRRQILLQHLALYVAGRESTDTITTTASLKTLFGSVLHAIADITSLGRAEGPGNTASARRIFYSSKADADDRIGSRHPTVKPVSLIRYLAKLITPPGGVILDPFAGTGTTGEAAWREGFKAILIEREEEYQEDIARRMDLVLKPTKRSAVVKTKGNLMGAEGTPLFGGEGA